MGNIWATQLPDHLTRWGVPYELAAGWDTRARRSGGFDRMRGIIVHHTASSRTAALASSVRWATVTAPAAPIGNALLSRSKDGPKLVVLAAGASNTAGRGGPLLSTRGLIPRDTGNTSTFNIEAENTGTTETWPDDMCDMYVRTVCAVLDWANAHSAGVPLGAGDVWAHHEWAPGRKIDPAGPSRFNGQASRAQWNMDRFRGEVWLTLLGGAVPTPPPADPPLAEGTPTPTMQHGDAGAGVTDLIGVLKFWGWYPEPSDVNDGAYGDRVVQGVANMQLGLGVVGTLGVYDRPTAVAYSAFLTAMQQITCSLPPTSRPGSSGADVVALQQVLAGRGWYLFNIDGQYGPRTAQAVQRLQQHGKALGVYVGPVHGVFDAATRDAGCRTL